MTEKGSLFSQNHLFCCRDLAFIINQSCFFRILCYIIPFSSGRLGSMVTCTLKLGISILNGGNVKVQQVRLYRSNIQPSLSVCPIYYVILMFLSIHQYISLQQVHVFLLPFFSRKCLITWKRKEMQAFSRASRDWCSLAGTDIPNVTTVRASSACIWLLSFSFS